MIEGSCFDIQEGMSVEQIKDLKRTKRFLKEFETPLGRLRHMIRSGKLVHGLLPDVAPLKFHTWSLLDEHKAPIFMICKQGDGMAIVKQRNLGGVVVNEVYCVDKKGLNTQILRFGIPGINDIGYKQLLEGQPSSMCLNVSIEQLNDEAKPAFQKSVWNVIYEIEKQLID